MGGTSLVRIRHRLLPSHLFSSCVFFFTFLVSLSVSWVGADSSSSSAAATLAAARSGIQPINIASSNVATTLLRQASAAYAVEQLTFDATTTQVASSGLLAAHLSGAYDLTVSTTSLSSSQLQATPQHYYFPLTGNAIVPVYNLPTSAGTTRLILPIQVLCEIERANITNWNDARIQAANPDLVMPDLGITVYHLSTVSSLWDGVTGACGKVDPIFASEIPRSEGPTWPVSKYFAYSLASTSDILASMVIDTPGAFSMCTMQNAIALGASYGNIRNYAGVVVEPTINSISLNILEMAVDPIAAGRTSHDLAGPISPNAWPICTLAYAWIDTLNPITTCATKRTVLSFLLWLYSSSVVKLLAESLNMAIVPDLFVTATDLLNDLKTRVTCQSSQLVSTNEDTGYVEGFNSGSQLLGSYFNYYRSIDTTRTYTFVQTSERLSIQRLVANEIDLAFVNTNLMDSTDRDLLITQAGGALFPAFYSGVAITFTLPTAISSKWSSWSSTSSDLPSLYPLALNLETVAQIFTGQITSWLDSRILATSPQLSSWFDRYPASPNFDVLVCCSEASEQPVSGLLLLQSLNQTATAKDPAYASMFYTSLSWSDQLTIVGARFNLIDREARMTPRASSMTTQGSSTIGYKLISTADTDQTSEFQIVQQVSTRTETVTAQPKNFQACAQADWDGSVKDTNFERQNTPITGCYPIAASIAIAVNKVYTDDDCTRGNRSLNLYSWIVSTTALSEAALNSGSFRIADLEGPRAATMVGLNSATCDGETLLITLPKVWEVNSGVYGFGWAVLSIGCTLFTVSGILLFVYRTRTVLRSSSVPFLAVTLLGLIMLVISVAAWTDKVKDTSCGAFMWLAPLGFSLVFVPFFAKTYRIWAIFSRKQLKVVKMSNKKLMVGVVGMILAEIILLIVWSQIDPLKPVEYLRNVSGRMHQATHCSVEGHGMTFVIIETVYKGLLLIVGTMLAFSTRKVSSAFNESSAIAWSIYNVLFSSILIGAIIYFVDAFEDTLILLLLFLIFWVSFVTWALMFGSKFYTLFTHSEADAALASKLSSMHTEKSGGFSFISVVTMPANMLKSYVAALEGQLTKARKQLTAALGTSGQGLGIGVGNKLRSAHKYVKTDPSLPGASRCDESEIVGELESRNVTTVNYSPLTSPLPAVDGNQDESWLSSATPGAPLTTVGTDGNGNGRPPPYRAAGGESAAALPRQAATPAQAAFGMAAGNVRAPPNGRLSPGQASVDMQRRNVLNAYAAATQATRIEVNQPDAPPSDSSEVTPLDSNVTTNSLSPPSGPVDLPGSADRVDPPASAAALLAPTPTTPTNVTPGHSTAPRPSSRATHQIVAAALKQ